MPPTSRTAFNRSPLVRTLASLDGHHSTDAGQTPAEQTLAERLGQWLDWTDAISLYGVLNAEPAAASPASAPATVPGRTPATASVLAAELRHLRQQLTLAIADDTALAAELAEHAGAPGPAERDWAPCRRRHVALQQAMAARTAPLRAGLRASLQARSPALARLAAIDALFEAALAERERHLLAKVPRLLEQHFSRVVRGQTPIQPPQPASHASAPTAPTPPTAPTAPRLQPDALRQTLQQLLLDELALRLQPLEGLLLALQQDIPSAT